MPNKKALPPFREPLQFIRVVETGEQLGIHPLECLASSHELAGNLNTFSAQSLQFESLARKSGQRFFSLSS